MKKIKYILLTGVMMSGLLCAGSCSGDGKAEPDVPQTPEKPSTPSTPTAGKLGTYTFGAKEYDIYSTSFRQNEVYDILVFSPLRPQDEKSTVLMLAVKKELDAVTLDVERYNRNDDYLLRYESPAVLYPENLCPQSGTIYLKQVGDDEFDVDVDVLMPDGTPLKLRYNGVFAPLAE